MGRGFDRIVACKNLFEAVLGLLNLPFDAKFKLVILVVISCVASRLLRVEKKREREHGLVNSLSDHFENVARFEGNFED